MKQKHNKTKSVYEQDTCEYKDKYLRALADYQNLARRTDTERIETVTKANTTLLKKLLVIGDDLEQARQHPEDKDGLSLILDKWHSLLKSEGVKKIEITENTEFNPAFMECIEAEKDGKKTIEVQAGYEQRGELLRPVRVRIIK